MVCSFPPPLTDDQLSAAMDGEADASVTDHIAACASCASQLDQARAIERVFHTQLYRQDCPPSQQLGNYHLGLLSQTEDRATVRHVEQCTHCAAELEELRTFLSVSDVQPARVEAVEAHSSRPRLREIIARVLPPTPTLALRGAATGPLMAEANGTTVILDMQSGTASLTNVLGQIVAEDQDQWTGALVELRLGGALQATTEVDDLGSFRVDGVPEGMAELRVTASNNEAVVLPDIKVGG
jgi:hypothetical protein